MSSENEEFEDAISKFQAAESALQSFLESGEGLRTAQQDLEESAQRNEQVYQDATARLEQAQREVADTSSRMFRLAEELKGIARDLADATHVVRKFEPERMKQEIADIHKTVNVSRKWIVACATLLVVAVALILIV
jgi:chromosome segregation ATPase